MDTLHRDNYILRIYRRDLNDPEKVVGQVEIIKTGERKPFINFGELCRILNSVEKKESL